MEDLVRLKVLIIKEFAMETAKPHVDIVLEYEVTRINQIIVNSCIIKPQFLFVYLYQTRLMATKDLQTGQVFAIPENGTPRWIHLMLRAVVFDL